MRALHGTGELGLGEMVLEAAVNARADFLVTHNGRDFASARFRGLAVVTPAAFLAHLEKELR